MIVVGFSVNKKEREELMQMARTAEFRHPQTGQAIRFLPPDSWIGTLVKVAVSEYIRYFNALKQGAPPQPQATKEQVAQVAAQPFKDRW